MPPILPAREGRRHRTGAWAISPADLVPRSAPATPGLTPMDLGAGAARDLGAVRLLAHRAVLVDALLLAVLAVQGLAHLRLQVVIRSGLGVIVGSHPHTLAPGGPKGR